MKIFVYLFKEKWIFLKNITKCKDIYNILTYIYVYIKWNEMFTLDYCIFNYKILM